MKIWIGVTDDDWFNRLSLLKPDEVNFWQPSGSRTFGAIQSGEPFLFKLHSPKNFIVGGGYFVGYSALPASLAWDAFREKNGVGSADELRTRYQNLQKVVSETNVQMASLQLYAKEVSVAYGIKQRLEGPSDVAAEGKLVPTFAESLADFNYLRSAERFTVNNRRVGRFGSATTPMLPAAIEAMTSHLGRTGNASSLHGSGRAARRTVEESRESAMRSARLFGRSTHCLSTPKLAWMA